jgi:putative FmdB family regulatory protein
MPTYEYRCPDGHEFEKFVRNMSDAASTLACPTCGVMAARRMSAGGGLLFKGSGFYITDYGKDGKKDQRTAAADAAKTEGATKEKSDAGKSDAGKSDAGKSDAGKSDAGKSDAGKTPTTGATPAAAGAAKATPAGNAPGGAKPPAAKPTPKSGPDK